MLARRLPEGEVSRMALARIGLAARSSHQLVRRVAREPAVAQKAGDVVIDRSVHLIGVPALDEPGDELHHPRDVRGRPRILCRRANVDLADVLQERLGVGGRDLLRGFLLQPSRDQHLVFAAVEGVVGEMADVGPDLRKGTVLAEAHLERVRRSGEIHLVELEPGDLHEDAAAGRLAAALAGPDLQPTPPVQSQARLVSRTRGLVRVRSQLIDAINSLGHISVFTLMDGQAVAESEEVAGCKVTPVAIAGSLIERAEQMCRDKGPAIELVKFRPLKTFVVATERLKPKARELFRAAVTAKLGWYGAEVLAVREVARTAGAVAAAYKEALASGADLVLFAGASAIDPLDPAYAELSSAGGQLLQLGAPMHPGSMLWLGRLGQAAVVGVASCAGFGRNSSLDLLLPFVFAYGRADAGDLLRLGHGGLIEAGAGRRFPPYS